MQPHRALRSDYVGMQSSQSDDHTTLLECANNDTVVTVEPPIGRNEEDSLSSISDVPTVAHFNISFTYDRTFREHEGARAGQQLETKIKRVYENVLQKSYRCYLGACGVFLACMWGITNGCVAFIQTWCISPCLRVSMVLLKGLLPLITEPIRICSGACCAGKGGAGSTFDPRNIMTLK